MDYKKLTARQAHSAGVYDGWHEANFLLAYNRPSGIRTPEFDDPKKAQRYAEGIQLGQERHASDLEVSGKRVTRNAAVINAHLRDRYATR